MFHYNDDNIQIFEKKYSIEEIVQLYRDERLIFVRDSKAYVHSNIYYNNKTTQLIEAIDIGVPFPPLYVSEQQNGDMVVFEKDDKLYSLIRYILGYDMININNEYYEKMTDFISMKENYRVLASKILRTIVSIEVIDYSTPKYLHIFAGNFIYNWTSRQEHFIREELYKDYNIDELGQISRYLYENTHKGIKLTEYEILQAASIWGIFNHLIQVDTKVKAQEQILIEKTILTMYKNNMYKNDYVNRAKVVVESGIIDYIMNYFSIKRIISRSRNRERAIIAGLCMCDNSNYDRLIDCLKNNKFLMDIRCSEVTFENVDRWLSYMYRR